MFLKLPLAVSFCVLHINRYIYIFTPMHVGFGDTIIGFKSRRKIIIVCFCLIN